MVISLGDISFDEDAVVRKLKNDFRDDWFPDPIGFADFIEEGLLSKIINENFLDNHGEYVPAQALLLNVPKANFTLRYALETSMTDRAPSIMRSRLISFPIYGDIFSWRVLVTEPMQTPGKTTATEKQRDTLFAMASPHGTTFWAAYNRH
jgi:hypothetical protein